jgi:autotransporter-associated beta strand protein
MELYMPSKKDLGKLFITTLAIPSLFLFSNMLLPQTAKAATRTCTWEGDVSANWDGGTAGDDTNWNCGGVQSIPTDGDELIFPSGPSTTTLNNNIADLDLDNLTFAKGYVINGNAFSLLYGITTSGSGVITINNDIELAATQTMTVSDTLTLNGVLSGTGDLAKAGSGGLSIFGTNTYTGTTTISGGAVNLHNQSGLGSSSAGTVIGSTTTLNLFISGMTITEPFTINGSGNVGAGAIRNFNGSGTNLISGNITVASDSQIQAESGNNLILSGIVQGSSDKTLYLGGDIQLDGANTFNGIAYVYSGSNITVTDMLPALVEMHGGTLNVNGTVKEIKSDSNSIIKPNGNGYGTISLEKISASGSTQYYFDLGTSDSDDIQSIGNVNLNNIELKVNVNENISASTSFVILENTFPGTLSGTFTGLADGATFISGGSFPKIMQIDYEIGNEFSTVTLTVVGSYIPFPTIPFFPTIPALPTATITPTPTDTVTPTPTDSVTPTSTNTTVPTSGGSATPTGEVLGASTSVLSDTGAAVPVILLGVILISSLVTLLVLHKERLKKFNIIRK